MGFFRPLTFEASTSVQVLTSSLPDLYLRATTPTENGTASLSEKYKQERIITSHLYRVFSSPLFIGWGG